MNYHFSKTINGTLEEAVEKVTAALKEEGFGILTQIDVQQTLKEKIGANFRPYRILGACNPNIAHQVLQLEDKIGVFLPCNVVVQQAGEGKVEVSAIDPVVNMQVVENPAIEPLGVQVQSILKGVIEKL